MENFTSKDKWEYKASGNLYISAIIELKTCYIILGFIKKEINGKKEQSFKGIHVLFY